MPEKRAELLRLGKSWTVKVDDTFPTRIDTVPSDARTGAQWKSLVERGLVTGRSSDVALQGPPLLKAILADQVGSLARRDKLAAVWSCQPHVLRQTGTLGNALARSPFMAFNYRPSRTHGEWSWRLHPCCETYALSVTLLDTIERWCHKKLNEANCSVAKNGILKPDELHVSPCSTVALAHASSPWFGFNRAPTWTPSGDLPVLCQPQPSAWDVRPSRVLPPLDFLREDMRGFSESRGWFSIDVQSAWDEAPVHATANADGDAWAIRK